MELVILYKLFPPSVSKTRFRKVYIFRLDSLVNSCFGAQFLFPAHGNEMPKRFFKKPHITRVAFPWSRNITEKQNGRQR